MGFGTLALIVAVGLAGPLLAALPRFAAPLVVGEILAGVVVGHSGFDLVPVTDPALKLLSETGFALLMLIVGTHLPIRDPALRPALGRAAAALAVTVACAVPAAVALASLTGLHQVAVITLLLTTSSAAVALPVMQALPAGIPGAVLATAWITVCDVVTVLAIPIVIRTGSLASVLLGILAVLVLSGLVFLAAHRLSEFEEVDDVRAESKRHHWALDLRISLLLLFVLSWIALRQHTSVLIAGFAAGVVVSLLNAPKRLAKQLIGLGEGFLVPLFFVTLGASLDLRALVTEPKNLLLAGGIAAGTVLTHVIGGRVVGLALPFGLLGAAQMGVPAAVATLGMAAGILAPGQAAAVLAAVLISLIACSAGAGLLGRQTAPRSDPAEASSGSG